MKWFANTQQACKSGQIDDALTKIKWETVKNRVNS